MDEEEMDSDLLLGALEATKHGGMSGVMRMLLERWKVQEEKLRAFEESLKEANNFGIPTNISERIDRSVLPHPFHVAIAPITLTNIQRTYCDRDEVSNGLTHNASGKISAPDKKLGFESPELEVSLDPHDDPEEESLEEFEKRIWEGLFKEQDFMLEQDAAGHEGGRAQEACYVQTPEGCDLGVERARYESEKLETDKQLGVLSEPEHKFTARMPSSQDLDRSLAPRFHIAGTFGSFAPETSQAQQRQAQIVKLADQTILTGGKLEGKLWGKLWEEWGGATTPETTKDGPPSPKFPEEEQQLKHEREAESCQAPMLDDSLDGCAFQKISAACLEDKLLVKPHGDRMLVDNFACKKKKKKKNFIEDRNNHIVLRPLCGSQNRNLTDSNLQGEDKVGCDDNINCRSFSCKLSDKAQIANLVCKPEEYSEDDFASRNLTRLTVCPGAPGLTTPFHSGHKKFQVDTDIMEELQIGDDDDTISDQRSFVKDDDNLSLLTRQRAKLFEDFMAAETERMKKRERDQVLKNEEVVRCSALAAKAQEHLYVCMYVDLHFVVLLKFSYIAPFLVLKSC